MVVEAVYRHGYSPDKPLGKLSELEFGCTDELVWFVKRPEEYSNAYYTDNFYYTDSFMEEGKLIFLCPENF